MVTFLIALHVFVSIALILTVLYKIAVSVREAMQG